MTSLRWQLEVLTARADARAILWASASLTLHDAVDELQAAAERSGLVRAVGQDHIQKIMGDAFARQRDAEC